MTINDSLLQNSERIILSLRELYLSNGYMPYRMSKFEEYDLYAGNKDFLLSDNVITFTDTSGKLMALKPDVTLSIIKNSTDRPDRTAKVFYNENVYRVTKSAEGFQEIMQTGVECFGRVEAYEICEVLSLAAESLKRLSSDSVLTVSDIDLLSYAVHQTGISSDKERELYKSIAEKNTHEIEKLCTGCDKTAVSVLKQLVSLSGEPHEVMDTLRELFDKGCHDRLLSFASVIERLLSVSGSIPLYIDFSVTGDTNYYNGIVFKGFVKGIPTAVLSGGQYDRLMGRMGRKSNAIGFAVYTDSLETLSISSQKTQDDGFINVALPKGRLGETIYDIFSKAGFDCPSILEPNRKLIFENPEKGVRYFWVKPADVGIYVERGAADIGVAGKDILLEYEPDVYELLDLDRGKCKMAVAAPRGYAEDTSRALRVATKFANVARKYYRSMGRDIDIIHLNGSIEIAPILGLSDVIVDIVETGTTLRENNLEVVCDIVPISARFISNKSAYKFKGETIDRIVKGLKGVLGEKK